MLQPKAPATDSLQANAAKTSAFCSHDSGATII